MFQKIRPKKLRSYKLQANGGFSLVELLVTVSIFVVITGIVLINFPSFSSKIALENLANEIALAVRQAQVFGIASREFGIGSGIFPTHGAHFDSAQTTTFFIYADTNDNSKYDGDAELLETFTVRRRNYISELCGFQFSDSICTPLTKLDITFSRPDPEPTILGTTDTGEANYSYATITIKSPPGNTRMVTVWSNGQIAIQ
tara:strand:+ start:55555 stop:56157 length:603 start_codon:yes stop_codon:yes gene_type:complete